MSDNMSNSKFDYSPEELAGEYGLSIEQARLHISRFGASRVELDCFLASSSRTVQHREEDIERTLDEVTFG
jgi:hypothetical protein